jgi:fucose 4-O-acetylase-like acetyltransferase
VLFALWVTAVVILIQPMREFSLADWFMYDESYSNLHSDQWWSGLVRLAALLIGAILAVAFLTLVPRRKTWFTAFGRATMYVYLLHSFILFPLRETGVLQGENSDATGLVSVVLCCVAISIALASPLIRTIFRPLVEPRVLWLFVHDAHDSPAPALINDRRAAATDDGAERTPDRTRRPRRSR